MARRWRRLWIGVLGTGVALVGLTLGARRLTGVLAKRFVSEAASATAGAWRYENVEHAFSLALPSNAWKAEPKGKDVARFAGSPRGIALTARVTWVGAHTKAEYEAALVTHEKELRSHLGAVGLPLFAKTTSEAGAPVFMATFTQRVESHTVFVAFCSSWLRERGITVETKFEARPPVWKNDGSLDLSGFEPMARGICLSLQSSAAVAASGVASAKAIVQPAPAATARSSPGTTKVPAFVFDWSPPCRVPVLEKRRMGGHTRDMRYWVHVRKGAAERLLVTIEGLEPLAYDGQDATGPEWRARLEPPTAVEAAFPTLELAPDGQIIDSQPMDQAIERVIAERRLSPTAASALRKTLDAPGEREHRIDDMRGDWWIWVDAWRGVRLRPGEQRAREGRVAGGNPNETRPMTLAFVSYEGGYATLTRTLSPKASGDARVMLRVELSPESLRPRLVRMTFGHDVEFASSAMTRGEGFRDWDWDWDHAEGCTK